MNGIAAGFLSLNAVALLLLPRRWALVPLLVGTCYIPFYLGAQLGPFHFSAVRVLIAIGVLRIIARAEFPVGRVNAIDQAMLLWASWLFASSAFHADPGSALIFRLGVGYDAVGLYLLVRCLCRSPEDVIRAGQVTGIVLIPLALEMLYEQLAGQNLFAILGGVAESPMIRQGRVRANGPFGHPIMAGTVGAVCLPMIIGRWKTDKSSAILGSAACVAIIISTASSGPILSAMAGIFALGMWHYRRQVHVLKWLAVATYIALDLVMQAPAYFLIARIDLAGGSTSWYRARLIQSAFEHLPEWWVAGTDYTRHWMPSGVSWSANNTDITSYYIQLGVWGGLPLMALFVAVLMKGFRGVTKVNQCAEMLSPGMGFATWTLGSSLFALAVTGLSVSYFDQSFVFLYFTLGTLGSAWSIAISTRPRKGGIRAGAQRTGKWHGASQRDLAISKGKAEDVRIDLSGTDRRKGAAADRSLAER